MREHATRQASPAPVVPADRAAPRTPAPTSLPATVSRPTAADGLDALLQRAGRVRRNVLQRAWIEHPRADDVTRGASDKKKQIMRDMAAVAIIRAGPGQMTKGPNSWRVDHQGPSRGPGGELGWINAAVQQGNVTYAALHFPPDMAVGTMRHGLVQAIDDETAYWWQPAPAPEPAKDDGKPKGGKGGKGGGPGKGSGGKGNWKAKGGARAKV